MDPRSWRFPWFPWTKVYLRQRVPRVLNLSVFKCQVLIQESKYLCKRTCGGPMPWTLLYANTRHVPHSFLTQRKGPFAQCMWAVNIPQLFMKLTSLFSSLDNGKGKLLILLRMSYKALHALLCLPITPWEQWKRIMGRGDLWGLLSS